MRNAHPMLYVERLKEGPNALSLAFLKQLSIALKKYSWATQFESCGGIKEIINTIISCETSLYVFLLKKFDIYVTNLFSNRSKFHLVFCQCELVNCLNNYACYFIFSSLSPCLMLFLGINKTRFTLRQF
jgi:hypothetical protein